MATVQNVQVNPVATVLYGVLLVHTASWGLVNLFLFFINAITTFLLPPWFIFPLLGWGLGLAIHSVVTLVILNSMGCGQDLEVLLSQTRRQIAAILPILTPIVASATRLVSQISEAIAIRAQAGRRE
eukprot:TRINITY_DN5516_c0_g1_i1.p1 TRINITY_DN5516_c0_g1~~TRINITY_DN5516_c0_g1_i1.p1  ORF type:complete len:127 (-),score=7.65 TRINITY_DN5516_c0_g1_i1:44-424(-)